MKIENILNASLCAFGQNTFDYYSLEEEEFIREFEEFMDAIDRERRERILMYRTAVSSHKGLPN